jgi:hypothetical protein
MGGWGAAGVGAGLAVAEALARSARGTALVACGAIGGGLAGALAHLAAVSVLEGLFGRFMPSLGGGLEGLVIGGAAGLGYALSTPRPGGGGMASPRGAARLRTAALTGACCAAAAVLLSLAGRRLGAASLDLLAKSFPGSRAGLDAIGALLGETDGGPASLVLLAACEGAIFGVGLAYGLTRRPRG